MNSNAIGDRERLPDVVQSLHILSNVMVPVDFEENGKVTLYKPRHADAHRMHKLALVVEDHGMTMEEGVISFSLGERNENLDVNALIEAARLEENLRANAQEMATLLSQTTGQTFEWDGVQLCSAATMTDNALNALTETLDELYIPYTSFNEEPCTDNNIVTRIAVQQSELASCIDFSINDDVPPREALNDTTKRLAMREIAPEQSR